MATIGTFKMTGNDEFIGENAPSHRVLVGRVEIGAAWSENEGRNYLGLKLDDPSFNAPIFANLFKDEDGDTHLLIWSRPTGRRGADPRARPGPYLSRRRAEGDRIGST
ncbi:Uncharacterized conserved protein, DUF736 family [Bradyrhizobium brasilense]|uniref:Uncharacterized conserved protein, DUF736 family n=1 Tax=Bradyrhizobium brasilense TaxID=1419277 RepID=A0A1G6RSR3_9BRAD|nr:Uncharacterized conserved protein, DUF736 family [Bradyrhizobium brasilense]